jgi:hypothetical protein
MVCVLCGVNMELRLAVEISLSRGCRRLVSMAYMAGRHWMSVSTTERPLAPFSDRVAIINAQSQTFLIGKSHPTGVYHQPLILPSGVAGDAGDKIADILDG